jgi:hypothetical protein
MFIGGVDVNVGDKIQFKTLNGYDTNIYTGTVSAICTATMAKLISDIVSYHTVLMQNFWEGKTPTSWQTLTYIIIADAQGKATAIATDWIDLTIQENSAGYFTKLDAVSDIVLQVTGVSNSGVGLLTYLRAGGYNASIVSTRLTGA